MSWNDIDRASLNKEATAQYTEEQRIKAIELARAYNNVFSSSEGQRVLEDLTTRFIYNNDTPLTCLLYTSPSPRDKRQSRMPSSA